MSLKHSQSHRVLNRLAIPYKSYVHPEETDSYFAPGSADLMTSPKGYAERRFGFSDTMEVTPSAFNDLQRLFAWNRFDGTFVHVACDINASNQPVVYKRVVGLENSFTSIFTDTSSTTPFDFVVSNNTLYFSNGNVAKKYDPVNGVTNWGIGAGSNSANTTQKTAGNGVNNNNNANHWVNPNNVTSATLYSDSGLVNAPDVSDNLKATQFGFGVTSTSSVTGLRVSFDAFADNDFGAGQSILNVGTIKAGVFTGAPKQVEVRNTTVQTFTLGGSSDLWSSTWTPNDVNQTSFGMFFGYTNNNSSVNNVHIRNVQITVFGTGGPSISTSGTGITVTTGWQYVVCYGNSNSGHVSSPGPPSSSTGAFTNNQVNVTVKASSDGQANQIRVFRSTDSVAAGAIAGVYFELPTSPYTNTNQVIVDVAADTSLNINSIAPIPGANDAPTPARCPVYFSGRIWMFNNNKVYFSALEENVNGVPEESFPSGVAGNFWTFDEPVTALAVAGQQSNQTLMIYCPGKIYGIVGSTLDTFRRFVISNRRGCRSITNVSSLGGMTAWVDTSSQIWGTDGQSLFEMGQDIRTDLKSIDQSASCLSFHTGGEAQWLLVSTGTQIFCADLDLKWWMPPWTFACQFLGSYEVSLGQYALVAGTATKALQLNQSSTVGKYNDNGNTYQPIMRLGLKSLVPDYSTYSQAYAELSSEPTRTAYATGIQVNTNSNVLNDVLVMVDDDPTNASTAYTSIFTNLQTPQAAYLRGQGVNLIQNIFTMNKEGEGRWIGLQVKGQNADDTLRLYSAFVGIKKVGA